MNKVLTLAILAMIGIAMSIGYITFLYSSHEQDSGSENIMISLRSTKYPLTDEQKEKAISIIEEDYRTKELLNTGFKIVKSEPAYTIIPGRGVNPYPTTVIVTLKNNGDEIHVLVDLKEEKVSRIVVHKPG
jgi:hypothetical protein